MEWQSTATLPVDFGEWPSRQFILVQGWKAHSGIIWKRSHWDVSFVRSTDPHHYRAEDMERIRRDGDMDGIDAVTHWAPARVANFPVGAGS